MTRVVAAIALTVGAGAIGCQRKNVAVPELARNSPRVEIRSGTLTYDNPTKLNISLTNQTSAPIYLDPELSAPFGICEKLGPDGTWRPVGSPFQIVRELAGAWIDIIELAPDESAVLWADCNRIEVAGEPAGRSRARNTIIRWWKDHCPEDFIERSDAWPVRPRPPVDGTFRVRASYSDSLWHMQSPPRDIVEVVSEPFVIHTSGVEFRGPPTSEEVVRYRRLWSELDLDDYVLYSSSANLVGDCSVFVEFRAGHAHSIDLVPDTSCVMACRPEEAGCMEGFETLVEDHFGNIEKLVGASSDYVEVEFHPRTGLPISVFFNAWPGFPDDSSHSALILVDPRLPDGP